MAGLHLQLRPPQPPLHGSRPDTNADVHAFPAQNAPKAHGARRAGHNTSQKRQEGSGAASEMLGKHSPRWFCYEAAERRETETGTAERREILVASAFCLFVLATAGSQRLLLYIYCRGYGTITVFSCSAAQGPTFLCCSRS